MDAGRSLRAALAALTTVGLLGTVTACSGHGKPGPTYTVTVTSSPGPSAGGSAASGGRASSGAGASPDGATAPGASTTAPAVMNRLPGTCAELLPVAEVDTALGTSIGGRTAFVVGTPDASIKRVAYLNCRYGLSSTSSTAAIEIGVSLYRTAAAAAARIGPTVDDYTQHGAGSSDVTVSGIPAHLLTGGSGAGYGPTIVLASGQRTVVVTLAKSTAGERRTLTALAALALANTAG